jgi:hypothetical protein
MLKIKCFNTYYNKWMIKKWLIKKNCLWLESKNPKYLKNDKKWNKYNIYQTADSRQGF